MPTSQLKIYELGDKEDRPGFFFVRIRDFCWASDKSFTRTYLLVRFNQTRATVVDVFGRGESRKEPKLGRK